MQKQNNIVQKIFSLSKRESSITDNKDNKYILSNSNQAAFLYIAKWPNWISNVALITGKLGTGKSYLAKIWQENSEAVSLNLFHSSEEELKNKLRKFNAFLLDDFSHYFSQKEKLRNLDNHNFTNFELTINEIINYCEEHNKFLLITSENTIDELKIKLTDLNSRLNSFPCLSLSFPDQPSLETFLIKKFSDMQLKVSLDVIKYICTHIDRSYTVAEEFAVKFDKLSLETKSPPNLNLAKSILR